MFKKILKRKYLILTALGIAAAFSFACKTLRPALISQFYPDASAAAAKKMLPIYCVDTRGEKKVAVSFDAAWGAGRLGSKKELSVSGKAPVV